MRSCFAAAVKAGRTFCIIYVRVFAAGGAEFSVAASLRPSARTLRVSSPDSLAGDVPAVPATFGAPIVAVSSTEVAIVDAPCKDPDDGDGTGVDAYLWDHYLRGKVALLMGKKGRKSDDDDEEEACSRAAQAAAASRAGAVAVLFVHEGGRIDTELPSTFGLANREDLDENFNTTTTTAFHFVHAGGECNSKDHDLGSQPSAACLLLAYQHRHSSSVTSNQRRCHENFLRREVAAAGRSLSK